MGLTAGIREGDMPDGYELLFERVVDFEGRLAKQQFYGRVEEGCENTFAMKYELIKKDEKPNVFQLLEQLKRDMESARETLADRGEYEEAAGVRELLSLLAQLKDLKRQ